MTDKPDAANANEPPKIKIGINPPPDSDTGVPDENKSEPSDTQSVPPPKLKVQPKAEGAVASDKVDAGAEKSSTVDGDGTSLPPKTKAGPGKTQSIVFDDIKESSLEDLYKAALNATQRVILDEKQKAAATGRVDSGVADVEAEKKSSAQLDVQDMLSVDKSEQEREPVRTVKIERPVEDAGSDAEAEVADVNQLSKSETARIDLPREVASSTTPATQRKTIRIKRPDAASTVAPRTLKVARTSAAGEPAEPSLKATIARDDDEDTSASPLFAVAAVIAVLVSLAVVYLLAATLYSGIPFPGRLV